MRPVLRQLTHTIPSRQSPEGDVVAVSELEPSDVSEPVPVPEPVSEPESLPLPEPEPLPVPVSEPVPWPVSAEESESSVAGGVVVSSVGVPVAASVPVLPVPEEPDRDP